VAKSEDRKIRVLVAKPGTDSHYRGAELLCQILRNAGMEVVYTGRYQTSDMIVNTAVAEDVDVVCLSSLAWAPTSAWSAAASSPRRPYPL
jgi:methylmalonyl-CoA mutase C-terminal domain/subunit